MKIEAIEVNGLLAAKSVSIAGVKPVHLVAAASCEAGKTSAVRDALALVLGRMPRELLKGTCGALVSSGHERATVEIRTVSGEVGKAVVQRDNKARIQQLGVWGAHPLAGYLLDPLSIADRRATKPEALKGALFAALGLSAEKDAIRTELLRRGRDAGQVEALLPLLRGESGMADAAKEAERKATEAKGEWKAVAGEQWGSVKGESWSAATVDAPGDVVINDMRVHLARCTSIAIEVGARVATLRERLRAKVERGQAIGRHEAVAANRQRVERKLAIDRANLEEQQREVGDLTAKAGAAPREGLVHDLAAALHDAAQSPLCAEYMRNDVAAVTALLAYQAQHGTPGHAPAGDPEARAALPGARQAMELMQNAVSNSERDLRAVVAAEAVLQDLRATDAADSASASALAAAEADEKLAREAQQAAQAELDTALALRKQAADAAGNTERARKIHARVVGWLDLAGDLSPGGIPGEMLARAIEPIDRHMLASCQALEIEPVQLHADMSVTKGAHPYALLSAGGRWITSAVLGAALAAVSGQRWVVLDGMDVLPPSQRLVFLWWLSTLADAGDLDFAPVTATLGSKPNLSSLPGVGLTWLERGSSVQQ